MAVSLTTLVVVSLTIFAIQTKWDFTVCGGLLFVAGIVFIVVSLILSLTEFGRNNTVSLVVSSFGVLLFAVYLICEYRYDFREEVTIHILISICQSRWHTVDCWRRSQEHADSRRVHCRGDYALSGYHQYFLVHFTNFNRDETRIETKKLFKQYKTIKLDWFSHDLRLRG